MGSLEQAEGQRGAEPLEPVASRSLDLIDVDLADARNALERADEKASKHLLWAMLGLSPAALIPLIGLFMEGSFNLIGPLIVLVFAVEGARYLLTRKEANRLHEVWKEILRERREALEAGAEQENA